MQMRPNNKSPHNLRRHVTPKPPGRRSLCLGSDHHDCNSVRISSCAASHRGCTKDSTVTVTSRTTPSTWPDTHSILRKCTRPRQTSTISHVCNVVKEIWYVPLCVCLQYGCDRQPGGIIYTHVLGREMIILNSEEAAVALLEKRSQKYSDRPTPGMSDLYASRTLIRSVLR